MNLQDFAALKPGDRIEGMNGSKGEIVGLEDNGVQLRWDGSSHVFTFVAQSTAWMHWRKIGVEGVTPVPPTGAD